jgi:processive 1,2-diacylglycerol beta-glucosyltransferase
MTKVLILSAGFGEGHNAAARNIAEAADMLAGKGTSQVADLFSMSSPRADMIARKGYLWMINQHPKLWGRFYKWIDAKPVFPRYLWLLRKETALLSRLCEELKPDVICSTYPVYAFLANELARQRRLKLPLYTTVTDSISINSLWSRPKCNGWFVPNAETAEQIRIQGVPSDLLYDYGFPVQRYFYDQGKELNPPSLENGAKPRVLVILNSGLRNAEGIAGLLLQQTDWELCIAVGRDKKLFSRLQTAARSRPAKTEILSWTDRIPELLLTHHAVVSKAGGATTQEAIAARCPMIVTQIVPGQEEGNYELLRRRKVGTHAETPEATVAALRSAFADSGLICKRWREALTDLSRPEAAITIAKHLLAACPPR